MAEVGTAAAWLLAAVFAWAALAKIADRDGTTAALAGLGLPAPRSLARALPVGEVGVAAVLLLAPAAGGALALAALTAFTVVLATRLRRGDPVRCGCFGGASSAPVSRRTLARNGLLALAAVAALGAGGGATPSLPAAISVTTAALIGATGLGLAELHASTGRLFSLGALPAPPSDEGGARA